MSSIILCVVYLLTPNGQPENVALCEHIRMNFDQLLMHQPNESCADLKSLANKVNNYFASLTDGFEALKYSEQTIQPVPLDVLVSLSEVQTSLSSLNISKGIGPNMIPNRVHQNWLQLSWIFKIGC